MKNKLIVLFGWYGVFAIVLAYALLSFGVIDSTSLVYQILNITGALGIVIISFHKKNYQPAILNTIWMIVGIMAIIKIIF